LLQSGLTMGVEQAVDGHRLGALIAFGSTYVIRNDIVQALVAGVSAAPILPLLVLRFLRGRGARRSAPSSRMRST